MWQKDRGHLKLHFSAINSSTNSQHQEQNRLYPRRQNGGGNLGGGVNSESNDYDVSACPWHTDAWSGSTYEQSEQVLALWDHFCSFQDIDDLQYLKFSIFRPPGAVKISCFKEKSAAKVLLCIKM